MEKPLQQPTKPLPQNLLAKPQLRHSSQRIRLDTRHLGKRRKPQTTTSQMLPTQLQKRRPNTNRQKRQPLHNSLPNLQPTRMTKPKLRLDEYLPPPCPHQYSCTLLGHHPSNAYQRNKDGQIILVTIAALEQFEIVNQEFRLQHDLSQNTNPFSSLENG